MTLLAVLSAARGAPTTVLAAALAVPTAAPTADDAAACARPSSDGCSPAAAPCRPPATGSSAEPNSACTPSQGSTSQLDTWAQQCCAALFVEAGQTFRAFVSMALHNHGMTSYQASQLRPAMLIYACKHAKHVEGEQQNRPRLEAKLVRSMCQVAAKRQANPRTHTKECFTGPGAPLCSVEPLSGALTWCELECSTSLVLNGAPTWRVAPDAGALPIVAVPCRVATRPQQAAAVLGLQADCRLTRFQLHAERSRIYQHPVRAKHCTQQRAH